MKNRFVIKPRLRHKGSNQIIYWVFDLQYGGYLAGENFSDQDNALEEAEYWSERRDVADVDEQISLYGDIGDDGVGIRIFDVSLRG